MKTRAFADRPPVGRARTDSRSLGYSRHPGAGGIPAGAAAVKVLLIFLAPYRMRGLLDDVDETGMRGHHSAPSPMPNWAADSLGRTGPL